MFIIQADLAFAYSALTLVDIIWFDFIKLLCVISNQNFSWELIKAIYWSDVSIKLNYSNFVLDTEYFDYMNDDSFNVYQTLQIQDSIVENFLSY